MADIGAIRLRIAEQLKTVERHDGQGKLRASDVLLDKVNPPCAVVALGAFSWDDTQPDGVGMDIVPIKVILYAARGSETTGQRALDAYLSSSGASSVKAALEANRKLRSDLDDPTTGLCDRLRVLGTNEPGAATIGEIDYLAVEINLAATCAPD